MIFVKKPSVEKRPNPLRSNKRSHYFLRNRIFPYAMLLPAIVFFTIFVIYPFLKGIYVSFFDWNGLSAMKFVGLANYKFAFTDPSFWAAMKHTGLWVAVTTIGKNLLGFILAYIMCNQVFAKDFFRTVAYLPVTLSMVICGLLWTWIFNPSFGLLNEALRALGLENLIAGWLSDTKIALYSVMWVDIWQWAGFHMVLYLAGLQGIPRELYEAAAIDGSSRWQSFLHVTIPQLNSTIVVNVMMAVTGGFIYNYEAVSVMTKGGPANATEVALTYITKYAFTFYKYGRATAMTVVLVVITLIFGLIQVYTMTKDENYG